RRVVHVDHIGGEHVEKRDHVGPAIRADGRDASAICAGDQLTGFCFRKHPVLPSQLERAHGFMSARGGLNARTAFRSITIPIGLVYAPPKGELIMRIAVSSILAGVFMAFSAHAADEPCAAATTACTEMLAVPGSQGRVLVY